MNARTPIIHHNCAIGPMGPVRPIPPSPLCDLGASAVKPRLRPAFTLVELLVVIGIIGILISIILPALAGARERARETTALANLRSVGIAFQTYADQYKAFPYAKKGVPVQGDFPLPIPADPNLIALPWIHDGMVIATNSVWALSYMWPGLLTRTSPWSENFGTWVSVGRDRALPEDGGPMDIEPERLISLRYSNSFLASPKLWQPATSAAPIDESLLRAIAPSDVAAPARKVLLWDAELFYLRRQPQIVAGHLAANAPMTFADLHAALHDPTKATPGFANPLNGNDTTTLHNTPGGVQGFDY